MSYIRTSQLRSITSETLHQAIGLESQSLKFSAVGDIHSCHASELLSYIKDPKYIDEVNKNKSISGVICTASTAAYLRNDIVPIIVKDPNWAFFTLVDFLGKTRTFTTSSLAIDFQTTLLSVASVGVVIEHGVNLEAFAVVQPGTKIGARTIVRAGAVLGLDTFQHQRTSFGMISPAHDGDLIIEEEVEIGAHAVISKGFSYRNTFIGCGSKLDAGVYIGHGAHIGKEAIICAGARIMGHCRIGDGVFIGPGAIVSSRLNIGDKARISLGAVVTKDVPSGQAVSGNFAIPHDVFMANLKKNRLLGPDDVSFN